ncbi:MAG: glycoside hydrolase family 13 protein [Eubacteriales bacterium]
MNIKYNSQEKQYKNPFGAVPCGTAVNYMVESDADSMLLHGFGDAIHMEKADGVFRATAAAPDSPCLVHYYFEAIKGEKHSYITPLSGVGGICQKSKNPDTAYQLTVYQNTPTPDWFKGAVMYQIYVDRFFRPTNNPVLKDDILYHTSWSDMPLYIYDSDMRIVEWDFFGGSLQGVIEKLDYIKSLGVDVIYLNPIFEAASNHKYDTGDYTKADPMYGSEKDLKQLIDKARSMGMNIILDGVFSHTGDDSIYFNKYANYDNLGAYQGEESPYYSWFTFENFPDKYKSWWGIDALPEVNKDNPAYRNFLFGSQNSVLKKWMEMGIMGWRLDVADELPDDFIKEMKQAAKSFCRAPILLGEVWEDASNKVSYGEPRKYIIDDTMDSVSNYPLRDAIIGYLRGKATSNDLGMQIMSLQENYPSDVFQSLMNLSGTHDSIRLATLLGDAPDEDSMDRWQKRKYKMNEDQRETALQRIRQFFAILFALPGNPCIYYGDETAIEGYKDPYNRSTFPWGSTDKSLQDFVTKLSALRKEHSAFKYGFFTYQSISDDVFCFTIEHENEKYTAAINRSKTDDFVMDMPYSEILIQSNAEAENGKIILKSYGAFITKM